MMKESKLKATTQRDYYGKAIVITDTESGEILLKSYQTIVCKMTAGGDFVRMWGGYSRTTANHINDFRRLFGLAPVNKREWDAMPCESPERYRVEMTNAFSGRSSFVGPVFDDESDAYDFAESLYERDGYSGRFSLCVICDC